MSANGQCHYTYFCVQANGAFPFVFGETQHPKEAEKCGNEISEAPVIVCFYLRTLPPFRNNVSPRTTLGMLQRTTGISHLAEMFTYDFDWRFPCPTRCCETCWRVAIAPPPSFSNGTVQNTHRRCLCNTVCGTFLFYFRYGLISVLKCLYNFILALDTQRLNM